MPPPLSCNLLECRCPESMLGPCTRRASAGACVRVHIINEEGGREGRGRARGGEGSEDASRNEMDGKEILLEENAGEGEGERGRSAIRDKVIE